MNDHSVHRGKWGTEVTAMTILSADRAGVPDTRACATKTVGHVRFIFLNLFCQSAKSVTRESSVIEHFRQFNDLK